MSELVPLNDRTNHEVFCPGLHFVLIYLLPIKPFKHDASFLIPKIERNGWDGPNLTEPNRNFFYPNTLLIQLKVKNTKEMQSHTPPTLFSNLPTCIWMSSFSHPRFLQTGLYWEACLPTDCKLSVSFNSVWPLVTVVT